MNEEYDPRKIEREIRKFWKENSIYERVRKSTEGNEPFFLLDGPPYLNAKPHIGHIQGKTLKDVMLRFKQMQGYDVWDQAGWDTHGLPNEVKTEKELGFETKEEVEEYGVERFLEKCRERAIDSEGDWDEAMEKFAVWQDFESPYLTYNKNYIESIWWFVSQAEDRDMLYPSKRPIFWCPRCQTSLSGYEVTDEYRDIEDHSIFVKFPLKDKENEYLLIWTTTPWTIPGNLAVLLNPDFRYARVEVGGEVLVMAEELVEDIMEKIGAEDYDILNSFYGSELQGKEFRHPLEEEVPKQRELDDIMNVHLVQTSSDLVTLEQGTGCVHTAPGHGEEDYEATRVYDLPVFSPVDKGGKFTEEAGKYEGKYVHETNEEIIQDLEDKGLMLHTSVIEHEYPFCWRCKTKLIQRAAKQWFLDISPVKNRMLEENEDVDWVPRWGQKRFRNWVEDARDWCISRQIYWGAPLPIWTCEECDERDVISGFDELEDKVGKLPEDFDPHMHQVDKMTWDCDCGGEMTRVRDIADVWLESGCAPFASMHYPREREKFEELFPADFITESSDQIRGWFYSLLFTSVTAFDQSPYEKVLFQQHVLDDEGKKMSKSLGNVVDPIDVWEEFGADLNRFYLLSVEAPWEHSKFDEEEVRNEVYNLFSVYWNTTRFLADYRTKKVEKPDDLKAEDKWILSKLEKITEKAHKCYENCHYHEFTREWKKFVLNDLSRWYVKLIRKRAKGGDERAIWTLQKCLEKANLLISPVAPHISERIYQDLFKEKESIHMCEFPEVEEKWSNEKLEGKIKTVRKLTEKVNSLREEQGIKLRWPVKELVVSVPQDVRERIKPHKEIVERMTNLKNIRFGEVQTKLRAEPNYPKLGPKFKGEAEKVADIIEGLDVEEVEELKEEGSLTKQGFEIEEEDVNFTRETSESISGKEFEGGKVFLDSERTEEVEEEIKVSELLRDVQLARKEEGLHVKDKIDLYLDSNDNQLLEKHVDKIKDRLEVSGIMIGELKHRKQSFEFDGFEADIGFKVTVKHGDDDAE